VIRAASSNQQGDEGLGLQAGQGKRPALFQQPKAFAELLEGNKKWHQEMKAIDPAYFQKLAEGQQPKFLWIGCSDSRVPAETITGAESGQIFVHRNIANMVVSSDINLLSVLQYSVEALKVEDIIVCGHYECGGVKAAIARKDLGLIDNWLRNIRDVYRIHQSDIELRPTEDDKFRRLVELNVTEQCLNLFKINIIQKSQSLYRRPRIHGLVYDIADGLLKDLNVDLRAPIRRLREVYALDYEKPEKEDRPLPSSK